MSQVGLDWSNVLVVFVTKFVGGGNLPLSVAGHHIYLGSRAKASQDTHETSAADFADVIDLAA